MKNKFIAAAMILSIVGFYLDARLVGCAIVVALTGLFWTESK